MASKLLGRVSCVEPGCGFQSAHIKIADGEGKRPYRHCPDCGAQYFPRNVRQVDNMTKGMRVEGEPKPESMRPLMEQKAPAIEPPAAKVEPEAKGYKIVFGVRVPV